MAINAKLWVPPDVWVNLMPPVPNTVLVPVPVAAFLTNQGTDKETLFAPRPCDVHYWEVRDAQGRVVQAEGPETCLQIGVRCITAFGDLQPRRASSLLESCEGAKARHGCTRHTRAIPV